MTFLRSAPAPPRPALPPTNHPLRRSTAKSCALSSRDPCAAYEDDAGCAGFDNLWLVGTNTQGPYHIVVTAQDGSAADFDFGLLNNEV